MGEGELVVSVDMKKKEIIGNLGNTGGERRSKGEPVEVLVDDVMDKE
jgi:hypothetical protein